MKCQWSDLLFLFIFGLVTAATMTINQVERIDPDYLAAQKAVCEEQAKRLTSSKSIILWDGEGCVLRDREVLAENE